MKPTILEWIESSHLPKGKQLAIVGLFKYNSLIELSAREREYGRILNKYNALEFAFDWDQTDEGFRFWRTEHRTNHYYLNHQQNESVSF